MRRRDLLRLAVAVPGALAAPAARAQSGAIAYPQRDDVRMFIDAFTAKHDVPPRWIERVLAQGRYLAAVEQLMQPPIPFGQRNWLEYRARYVEERRIRAGIAFFNDQRAALQCAEAQYGVPPAIVTAILGVETLYGRMTGGYRTLDVLLTLSFDYLRRADYFRDELEEFLLLTREQHIDPLAVRGSFAGAIGMPQFMPSSVRRWAVDFDGDGRIDLQRSAADSIGSVANFLAGHGWQRDAPVLLDAQTDGEIIADLVEQFGGGIRADTPWSILVSRGVEVQATLGLDTPVLLVDLPIVDADGAQRREYRVGTASFSAVLHYNRSYFYGAAVVELARALNGQPAS